MNTATSTTPPTSPTTFSKQHNKQQTTTTTPTQALEERVGGILMRIEAELDDAERTIGERLHVIDLDNDGLISRGELEAALRFLKANLDGDELRALLDKCAALKGVGREGGSCCLPATLALVLGGWSAWWLAARGAGPRPLQTEPSDRRLAPLRATFLTPLSLPLSSSFAPPPAVTNITTRLNIKAAEADGAGDVISVNDLVKLAEGASASSSGGSGSGSSSSGSSGGSSSGSSGGGGDKPPAAAKEAAAKEAAAKEAAPKEDVVKIHTR